MSDTSESTTTARAPLSHDMPCVRCGHALHVYLACDESCACGPQAMPGLPARPSGTQAMLAA